MKHIIYILLTLLLFLTPGCVDDMLMPDGHDGEITPETPYTITFTVGVTSMGNDGATGTRAIYYGNPLYYEDWIDTQDGLRVLFFITKREKTGNSYVPGKYDDDDNFVVVDPNNPLKDYFLFESTSRWVTQLPYDEDNTLRYRLTVPVYQIGDEESEYREHWATIRKYLRDYDFKVAILANHPNENTFRWGVENSVLSAKDIDNLKGESKIKTINDIHHSVADYTYAENTSGNRKDAYQMLVDSEHKIDGTGTMGPFSGCVINRSSLYGDALGGVFSTKETAKVWIRDYWIPDLIYNEDTDPDIEYKTLYHNYRHIWSYWNFGGAAADNGLPYSDKSKLNPHLNDWEVRNGKLLREWHLEALNNGGVITKDLSTKSTANAKYDGSMPLTFHPSSSTAVITQGTNGKRFYGVKIPKLSSTPSKDTDKDCFIFNVNGAGTATVRYIGSATDEISIKLDTQTKTPTATKKTINGVTVYEAYVDLDQINEPGLGFVYSTKGTTVLDVEYTQDRYLYLTDREGILPSSDHPIPMYGVQKFDRLEGWWDEGASFDLTNGGQSIDGVEYNAKTISLLRAVAKIELLIPKSIGVPKHVYLHSLNSTARCEPMDVATPTDLLWKDHNKGCEWTLVQSHGTFLSGTNYETNEYKKKLAWYHGNWLEWGWNFNNYTQWKPNYDADGPFPRIFNPYISRSDCAAFIDISDYFNDQYYHYLFYMGENTIDASSSYNGAGGSIMIPHIEIRFDERYASTSKVKTHSDLNLMDGNSYHIYFTDKGIASGARDANGASIIPSGSYRTQYENKVEYLKEHWPIMRNHVYRFTVQDATADGMNILVDAQQRGVELTFD